MVKKVLLQVVGVVLMLGLIFSLSFIYGCAPKLIDPIRLPEIPIEKEEVKFDGVRIEKPDKPKPILFTKDLILADSTNDITYFAFDAKEFSKIVQLSKAFDVQEEIISLQEDEINKRILRSNGLIDTLNEKNAIAQNFADLYINEKNLRNQEVYQCERDKRYNKILLYVETGVILILTIMK